MGLASEEKEEQSSTKKHSVESWSESQVSKSVENRLTSDIEKERCAALYF